MRISAILLLLWASAAASAPADAEPIRIVASIPPVGSLAAGVAGDLVVVDVLLPPGATPHGFEPGPGDAKRLSRAELVLIVGRRLDDWAAVIARGVRPDLRVEALGVELPGPEPVSGEDEPLGDPHVWLDPVKAAAMCERLERLFIEMRPSEADALRARGQAFRMTLADLDSLCRVRLEPVRAIPFVAYHGGLNHMVARYGLDQVAVLELFPGREPSPRRLKETIDLIRTSGARVVFSEPQYSPRLAEVVAQETNLPVVEIDPIGGGPGMTTYPDLIRSTLDILAGALSGGARSSR